MSLEFGYNTNGFAHHRLSDAVEILAEIGYSSVAITLDHHALNPFERSVSRQVREVRAQLQHLGLCCVIETGARFLLDPRRKHQPTLLSESAVDRRRRLDFLKRAVETAAELEAEAVSFWSGAAEQTPENEQQRNILWDRLIDGCDALLAHAVKHDVFLAFEPEPGMFIQTIDEFKRLTEQLGHPRFGLTLDVGHVHCLGDGEPAARIAESRPWLFNVHLDDMRRGKHEHLMFGEGEIDFPPILRALTNNGYPGSVYVELSRHSHDAVNTARTALACLTDLMRRCGIET